MTDHIYFHTGYHSGTTENYYDMRALLSKMQNLQFVDPEDDSSEFHNVYEDASIFLQGACHLFSFALHQEFGYDAFEIRKGTSCHCFCRATYQGVPVYIDVRGVTTSWEEFLSGTCADFHDHDEIIPQDIEETEKLDDPDDLYVKDGFAFAKHLIHEHPEYYDISKVQFTRNYTQTVKRAADNKRRYAPGKGHSACLLWGYPKGAAPHLAHDFAKQSVVCYTLCRRCRENAVAAGEGKGI